MENSFTEGVWSGRLRGRAHKAFLVACGAPARGVQGFLPQEFGRELLQQHFREIRAAEVSTLHTKM